MRIIFLSIIVGIFAILLSNDCDTALQKHKEYDLDSFGKGNASLLLLIDKSAKKGVDTKNSDIINYEKLKKLFGLEYLTKEIKISEDSALCVIATNFSKLELKIPPNEVKKSLIVDL